MMNGVNIVRKRLGVGCGVCGFGVWGFGLRFFFTCKWRAARVRWLLRRRAVNASGPVFAIRHMRHHACAMRCIERNAVNGAPTRRSTRRVSLISYGNTYNS